MLSNRNHKSYSPAPPSNGLFNDWLSSPPAPSLAAIYYTHNNAVYKVTTTLLKYLGPDSFSYNKWNKLNCCKKSHKKGSSPPTNPTVHADT